MKGRRRLLLLAATAAFGLGALLPSAAFAQPPRGPGTGTGTRVCNEGATMQVPTEIGIFVYQCRNNTWVCIALLTGPSQMAYKPAALNSMTNAA